MHWGSRVKMNGRWSVTGVFRVFLMSFLCLALILTMPEQANETSMAYNNVSAAAVLDTKTHKEVRVGYVEIINFSWGAHKGAVKSGMAYDYMQRISYYTNWHYTYSYGDWDTMMQKLYDGEIDIMAGISKSPERMDKLLFPNYAMGSESYYIYVRSQHPLANQGVEGLAGRTISVNKNTTMEQLLQKWNVDGNHQANIRTYTGNEPRYRDFFASITDATVDTDNAVNPEEHMVPLTKIGQSDFYLAVTKSRPDLLEDLNNALLKINSTYPSFTTKLSNTYFSGMAILAQLQRDEIMWLKAHPVITVGYVDDYLPLSDTDNKGHVSGILKDVMKEMTSRLQISDQVKFDYIPFKSYEDMINAVKDGSVDMAFPVNNDVYQAEKDDLYLSSEVINVPMYLVYSGDFADLHLQRMSAKRGNSVGDLYIKAHFPDVELVYFDDIDKVLEAVKDGRVDGCILNQFRKDAYFIHTNYRDLKTAALKDYTSRCFAVKCGNNELLSILNRGITNLPTDFSLTSTYTYTGEIASLTFKDFFMQHIIFFMLVVSAIIALLSCLVAYIYFIRRNKKHIQYIARHDSLTSLYNRHCFDEMVDEVGRNQADDDLIVVAMDLNGLKLANDNMGHDAGDELLRGAAKCMVSVLAPYGDVYRTGGDEFMSILHADPKQWPEIFRRLTVAFDGWTGKKVKKLSVSIGSVCSNEMDNLTLNKMITIADQRMYDDKAAYYNRSGVDRRKNRR